MKVKFSKIILFVLVLSSLAFLKEGKTDEEKIYKHPPRRIICLESSLVEILYFLGMEDRIVGVTSFCKWPPEVEKIPKVGRGFGDLNLEMLIALEPDIILCWRGKDERMLSERGFHLFLVESCGIKGVIDIVRRVGEVVDKPQQAELLARDMEGRIKNIEEKLKDVKRKPLVYFEGGNTPFSTRAHGSLGHDLITLAGGINIAKDEPIAFPTLTNEYIIKLNPDVIIVEQYGASIDEIRKRPGWSNIPAVRNNRIYKQPSYYTYYSPRCIEGLEQFAKWFHPELFEEE